MGLTHRSTVDGRGESTPRPGPCGNSPAAPATSSSSRPGTLSAPPTTDTQATPCARLASRSSSPDVKFVLGHSGSHYMTYPVARDVV